MIQRLPIFPASNVYVSLRSAVVAGVVGLVGLAMGGELRAQTVVAVPNWVQASPASSPSARNSSTMAYDVGTGQVVLFGGNNTSTYLNETWTYNGTTWTQQSPASSPSARSSSTMVYDAATGQVVLFGGYSGAYLGDTWTYNGTTWTQQSPSSSPSAREDSMMAYDAASGQVVLFGGMGGSEFLNDTWTYDGTTWTQQSPSSSPPARYGGMMAYDAASGQVVLFGGLGSSGFLNDTWTYNGTTWTKQSPASSPVARDDSIMAYDAASSQVVLFGGYDESYLGDTWTYNGTTWTQQSPASNPSGRDLSMMAYDAATSEVVVFGGYRNSGRVGDTWNYGLQSFGTVAVGSNSTAKFTFNVTGSGTLGTPVVLTQGVANKDYTLVTTGTTCTGAVTAGSTCTVVAQFAPLYAGVRSGAVEVVDGSGNVLATLLVSGIGSGAQVSFSPGTISTVAGSSTACAGGTGTICGDGGAATSATLNYPGGVAVDAAGNMYVSDSGDNRIRKVTAGVISTYAGNGNQCAGGTGTICGDNGAATSANLYGPNGVALDGAGNLYIADSNINRIRMVNAATGKISTVAGTGVACGTPSGGCGDGGAATSATLNYPLGIAVDSVGNIYVADYLDNRVREITASTGVISTIAGNGAACSTTTSPSNPCGDGLTTGVNNTQLNGPYDVAVDASGNVYIADSNDLRVRMVSAATGVLSTVAGNGVFCATSSTTGCGDGGTAANTSGVTLGYPSSVDVDAAGNVYITDSASRVRKVTEATGKISTVAGSGNNCSTVGSGCGDGLASTNGSVSLSGLSKLDALGNLYLADGPVSRVRKVSYTAFPVSLEYDASGSAPATTTLTMNSIGNVALTFGASTNPTISSPFTLASGAGSCYALAGTTDTVGDSCTDTISFTAPALSTTYTGTLTTVDNAPDTPQVIALTGVENSYVLQFGTLPYQSVLGATPSNTITAGISAGVVTAQLVTSTGTNAGSTDQLQLVVTSSLGGSTTYRTGVTTGTVTPTLASGVATFDLSSVPQYAVGGTATYTYVLSDVTASTSTVTASVYVAPGSGSTARVMMVTSATAAADSTTANWPNECPDQNVSSPATPTGVCTIGDALGLSQSASTYAGSTIIFSTTLNGSGGTIYAGSAISGVPIYYSVTVSGNGPSNTFISGAASSSSPTTAVNTLFKGKLGQTSAVVTLSGLTLEYTTSASNGSALYLYGPANVNNVAFLNNKSTGASGGAMYVQSTDPGTVAITNSSFTGNSTTATSGGGAISDGATAALSISNTTFTSNTAQGNGGAIVTSTATPVTVTNSTFTSNQALTNSTAYSAGAIYDSASSGGLTITGSTFTTNTAAANAGAVYFGSAGGTLAITGSTFTGNNATSNGGGLYYGALSGTATLASTTFTNNVASSNGGGIYMSGTGSSLTINSSTFTGNNTVTNGGAILATGAANSTLAINSSTFTGNYSTASAGAIYASTTATVNITGSLFNGNYSSAGSGGAIYTGITSATNSQAVTYTNDTFTGNYALNNGGAIYSSGTTNTSYTNTTTLQYVTIVGNSVTNTTSANGGGMYTTSVVADLFTNSVIAGNSTGWSGGQPDLLYNNTTSRVFKGTIYTSTVGTTGIWTQALLGLANLGTYGGTTQTMPLLPGSPLLKNTTVASNPAGQSGALPISTVSTDERGTTRATTGGAGLVDIGAVQSNLSLAFTSTVPVGATVGATNPFAPQPVVYLTDSGYVLPANVPVTLTLSPGTLNSAPVTASTSTTTGVATFSGVSSNTPEASTSIVASASITGGTGTTAPTGTVSTATLGTFSITSAVSKLVYTTPPASSIVAGGNSGSVVVTLESSTGATVPDNSTITLVVTGPSSYTATYTVAAVNGVGTFTGVASVALSTAGTYTYTASYPTGQFPVVATEVVVGPVTHLGVVQGSAVAGFAATTTVSALDSANDVVATFTGTVTLTSSDAAAVLPSTYTFVSSDSGTHAFSTTLNTAGTQTITATSTSPSDTSGPVSVTVQNSVWLVNASGSVVVTDGSGNGLTGAVGTSGTASTRGGVAFDSAGGVWSVTSGNAALDYVSKNGTGSAMYTGGGLSAAAAVAVDGAGYIWVANSGNASVSEFKNTGTAVSGSSGYGTSGTAAIGAGPSGVAVDNAGGVWVVSKTAGTVTHLFGVGSPVTVPLATATKSATVGSKP